MDVFVGEVSLDNFSLFKAELILNIVEEMDFCECVKEEIIKDIIISLDDYDCI